MQRLIPVLFSVLFSFSCLGQTKPPKNKKDLEKLAQYLVDLVKENKPDKVSFFEYSEKEGQYLKETCEKDENQFPHSCNRLNRDIGTERNMFIKTFKNVVGFGQMLDQSKLKSMEITKVDQNFVVPGDFEVHKVKILFTMGDEKGEISISNVVKTKDGWFFVGDAGVTIFE